MTERLPDLQKIEIDSRELAWREAGHGPALVLVHGIGGHSGSWRAQFDKFASSRRVIAWDAPGYGGSTLGFEAMTADDYAGALQALLANIGVSSADVIGHSLGGVMLAALCSASPDLVRRAVFLQAVTGGGGLPSDEREKIRLSRIIDLEKLGMQGFAEARGGAILSPNASPEAIREAIAVMANVPQTAYLAAWDMMCAANIFNDLPAVHCPALVICGSDDPVAPPETGKRIAVALAEGRYEELVHVGHYASIEAPERLQSLLDTFLTD